MFFQKKIISTAQANDNTWVKLAECTIEHRYGFWGINIYLRSEGGTDAKSPYVHIICRGKQQNDMTADPTYSIKAIEWSDFTESCRLYITENTSSLKKVELWVSLSQYRLYRMTVNDFNGDVNFMAAISTPPDVSYIDIKDSGSINYSNIAGKLNIARAINLDGDVIGSANFDGSADISISANLRNKTCESYQTTNYPYHRIATASNVTGTYQDRDALLIIRQRFNGGRLGIIKISFRTNSSGSATQASASWLVRYGYDTSDIIIADWGVSGTNTCYIDVFLRCYPYARTVITRLQGSFDIIQSFEDTTTTTDKKKSYEVYASVENAGIEIHNQAYTHIQNSVDTGTVNTANNLGTARTIAIQGNVVGSASFDGSQDITIDTSASLSVRVKPTYNADKFVSKTWNGKTDISGNDIWTDGENIYYSYKAWGNTSTKQYVLDKSTSTWVEKTWSGITIFEGRGIWTDGENIYYNYYDSRFSYTASCVLDKSTSTWNTKTWNGLANFDSSRIWTDGENIYYGHSYVLNVSTSTWNTKTWNGLADFDSLFIWTDGEYIYYSKEDKNYVLNKATSTWTAKTWNGLEEEDGELNGNHIFTYKGNIYYSYIRAQYILDKATSTWIAKTWNGLARFNGDCVWSDGNNLYYSNGSDQYVLSESIYGKVKC